MTLGAFGGDGMCGAGVDGGGGSTCKVGSSAGIGGAGQLFWRYWLRWPCAIVVTCGGYLRTSVKVISEKDARKYLLIASYSADNARNHITSYRNVMRSEMVASSGS